MQREFFYTKFNLLKVLVCSCLPRDPWSCCLGTDSSGLQVTDDADPNLGGDSKDGEEAPGVPGGRNRGTQRKVIAWALPSRARAVESEQK